MNKVYKSWLNESLKISQLINGEKIVFTCPNCNSHEVDYQYIGDSKTGIGYLLFWCNKCLKGIHISRVIIPPKAKFISFDISDEELLRKVPNFEQVLP
ncbi:hypothetical protein [Vallitalea guaymasensis]|uniref:Uncharacterized protein n=1 Tax=Vallitalea guaymasensis TaxID=1185412 RepID=A0A8J8M9E0_9FIRM|nr:hypothetical protein [Vallitalea guaymasensis]QUH28786.1 hypothetical protein HYG85_07620 [Vallitalea guaymasensis]